MPEIKLRKLSGVFLILTFFSALVACNNDNTTIGSAIASGEVEINVDTFYFDLQAKAIEITGFDSKTGNLMVGNIDVEDYGRLNCSFVTRLMCAASLEVPDSLWLPERIDSVKLILGAVRDEIVGDSLAPQRITVYKLNRQLPPEIDNNFNPEGYYDPSLPFASRSYTVSAIAESDSAFYNNTYVDISLDLPKEFGVEIFEKYKSDPEIFQWPKTMAEYFLPGLYVKSTFGNGCIANILSVYVGIYYYSLKETSTITDDGELETTVEHVTNLAVPFTVSPEVLSSNNITYLPSQSIHEWNRENNGEVIITTPGGYIAQYSFPAQTLIDRYNEKNVHLSTVNDLNLFIPATSFESNSGIGVATNILMVKSSEYESFFQENKIPDNMNSFIGVYDKDNERYYFSSMRNYFLDLLQKDYVNEEDTDFILVPVEVETETVSSYYGEGATYVTKCVPFTSRPTMTLLNTTNAMVAFSFSTQMID
ncbi:MAG: DUF4270 family protein [Muribaculaceae bacterium]|nr:DUF4270 family protein [Muribaculaceae bacterium]